MKWGWFPIQHAYDLGIEPGLNWTFMRSAIAHGTLPALIIVAVFAGGWLLNMRNVMINTVEEDYVGMGHAKGLKDSRVMTMYAGRNAILPPLTGFASQFGAQSAGSSSSSSCSAIRVRQLDPPAGGSAPTTR